MSQQHTVICNVIAVIARFRDNSKAYLAANDAECFGASTIALIVASLKIFAYGNCVRRLYTAVKRSIHLHQGTATCI